MFNDFPTAGIWLVSNNTIYVQILCLLTNCGTEKLLDELMASDGTTDLTTSI